MRVSALRAINLEILVRTTVDQLDASNNRLLARLMDSDGGPRRFREAL
jgi:hypothetical protein